MSCTLVFDETALAEILIDSWLHSPQRFFLVPIKLMGAGASVSKDEVKTKIGYKDDANWVKADDITDLEAAKLEVAKLRQIA